MGAGQVPLAPLLLSALCGVPVQQRWKDEALLCTCGWGVSTVHLVSGWSTLPDWEVRA